MCQFTEQFKSKYKYKSKMENMPKKARYSFICPQVQGWSKEF